MMTYNQLCHETGNEELIPETTPATQKVQFPEISCEIKTSSLIEGFSYTLYISDNYDYYYVECYEYTENSPDGYLGLSGDRSSSELYLTAGSSLNKAKASVTPYFSDGTKGKIVSYAVSQPEYTPPKASSVPMPSDVTFYMGTDMPISSDGFLNLRSSRSVSSNSNIITQIPNEAEIKMYTLDLNSDWLYVEYGSYFGYVKKSYTQLINGKGIFGDGS